jgi:transposase
MKRTQPPFFRALLPDAPGLVLEGALRERDATVLVLQSAVATARCPLCRGPSSCVHSRYRRAPKDLPWGGRPVRLMLRVRRFFCGARSCERRIFVERLPEVVAPHARVTNRLAALLSAITFALGGEAGSRLAERVGVRASPATLISLIRRTPLAAPRAAPRVLGVDDWTHRKGHRYGTALVDLEGRRLVELLPDRTSETLRSWLEAHPGAEVVSRDRSEIYAAGAREGAPEATQVADRWHLLSNRRKTVERAFDRHLGRIERVVLPVAEPAGGKPAATVLPAKGANRRRRYLEEQRARAQAKRLARYREIRKRHAKGEYLTTIARDLGIDYKTARKYALSDECPTRKPLPPRRRRLDPYEPYLKARWAEGCRNGRALCRGIVDHGYKGAKTQVAEFVAGLRRAEPGRASRPPRSRAGRALTPHAASVLLLRRPERRDEAQLEALARSKGAHPEIAAAASLTERFARIVRERRGDDLLGGWLADAEASGVREIARLARDARKDEAAMVARCTLPWSNGQTEGQITRPKATKCSMYGRAKFDLLRMRALHAA